MSWEYIIVGTQNANKTWRLAGLNLWSWGWGCGATGLGKSTVQRLNGQPGAGTQEPGAHGSIKRLIKPSNV